MVRVSLNSQSCTNIGTNPQRIHYKTGDSKIKSFSRKEVILVPVPKMEFRIQDIYMGLFSKQYYSCVPSGTWFDVYNANDLHPTTFNIGDVLNVPAGYAVYIIQDGKIIKKQDSSKTASKFVIEAFPGLKTTGLIKKSCNIIAFIIATHPNVFYNTARKEEIKLYVSDEDCKKFNLQKGFRCPCTFNLYSSIVYKEYDVLRIIKFFNETGVKRNSPTGVFFRPGSYLDIFIKKFLEKHLFIDYPQLIDTRNGNQYISGGEKATASGKEKEFLQKLVHYLASDPCSGLGFTFLITVGPLSICPYEKLSNE